MPSSLWLMQKRSSLKRLCTPCCIAPCISWLQKTVDKLTLTDARYYGTEQMGRMCWLGS